MQAVVWISASKRVSHPNFIASLGISQHPVTKDLLLVSHQRTSVDEALCCVLVGTQASPQRSAATKFDINASVYSVSVGILSCVVSRT